ncbi:unnamed protein product [Bemisia tabaci]|uniref:DNA-directed RNA polymerase subunit n=1 Tax=Bemisia tabaci TaxID=7038 RepID=A0A9P0F5D3_BEMTA|nr:PREDICTED: DNA-directed RNA polymerase I subunit RPA12 [Bemisia tabaci]CAH0392689.1 unnamed protein product [Bemisia tabaci]
MSTGAFDVHAAFCSECGSVLPFLTDVGGVECYQCKKIYEAEVFKDVMKNEYTIHFNTFNERDLKKSKKKKKKQKNSEPDGPLVERKCPKCDNDKMSYATLQLRSADEGQTVFYTCTRCKFKETENS